VSEQIEFSIEGMNFFDSIVRSESKIDISFMGRFGLDEDECFWHGVCLSRRVLSLRVVNVRCTCNGWLQMLSLRMGMHGEKANIPRGRFARAPHHDVSLTDGSTIDRWKQCIGNVWKGDDDLVRDGHVE